MYTRLQSNFKAKIGQTGSYPIQKIAQLSLVVSSNVAASHSQLGWGGWSWLRQITQRGAIDSPTIEGLWLLLILRTSTASFRVHFQSTYLICTSVCSFTPNNLNHCADTLQWLTLSLHRAHLRPKFLKDGKLNGTTNTKNGMLFHSQML